MLSVKKNKSIIFFLVFLLIAGGVTNIFAAAQNVKKRTTRTYRKNPVSTVLSEENERIKKIEKSSRTELNQNAVLHNRQVRYEFSPKILNLEYGEQIITSTGAVNPSTLKGRSPPI